MESDCMNLILSFTHFLAYMFGGHFYVSISSPIQIGIIKASSSGIIVKVHNLV